MGGGGGGRGEGGVDNCCAASSSRSGPLQLSVSVDLGAAPTAKSHLKASAPGRTVSWPHFKPFFCGQNQK